MFIQPISGPPGRGSKVLGFLGDSLSSFFMSKNWMPWPAPSEPMIRVSPTFLISLQITLCNKGQHISHHHQQTSQAYIIGRTEATHVFELTLLGDLSEGCTVGLTDGDELPALMSPSPATASFAHCITKLGVCLEVVHVLGSSSQI
jgi:hypothetical protein